MAVYGTAMTVNIKAAKVMCMNMLRPNMYLMVDINVNFVAKF